MKKIALLLCTLLILISCVSCKQNTEKNNDGTESTDTRDVLEITPEEFKTSVISEGGTEPGLWPTDALPSGIPPFTEYTEMQKVSYQDDGSVETWGLGFITTRESYESWLNQLIASGFKQSSKITGLWGNGEVYLDIYTENDDTFYLSIDISRSLPVQYPEGFFNVYSQFTTDATLRYYSIKNGANEGEQILEFNYICPSDFSSDIQNYKTLLAENGFEIGESEATKQIDGRTFRCKYADFGTNYNETISFNFYK